MNGNQVHNVKVVKGLTVTDLDGDNSISLPKAFTKLKMPATNHDVPRPELARKWPHLARVAAHVQPLMSNVKIGLLIGTNCPEAIEPKDFVTSQNGGPYAVKMFAGWTIIGPLHVSSDGPATVNCNRIVVKEIRSDVPVDHYFAVDQMVKEILTPEALNRMMEIDFSERKVENERSLSQEDKLFLKKVKQGTKKVEGHYEIPLPFREDDVIMPDNRAQVEQRAHWIKKKLLKDNLLRKQYTEFMNDMLVKGYARKVPLNTTAPEERQSMVLAAPRSISPKKARQSPCCLRLQRQIRRSSFKRSTTSTTRFD